MKRTFLTASALALLWASPGLAQNTTDPATQPPTGTETAPSPAGEAPADPGMTQPTAPPTGAAPPAAEPTAAPPVGEPMPSTGTGAPAGEAPDAPTGAQTPPTGETTPTQPGTTPGGMTGGTTGMAATAGQTPTDWAKYDNGGKGYLSALEFGSWVLARQGNDMTAEVERTKTSKRANLPAVKVLNATGSEFMKADKDGNRQISPDELAGYSGR